MLAVCLKLFFSPIDIQQASTSPARPVSVPIRHPSGKSSAVTSFETDVHIHRKYNNIPGSIFMRVASGLFSWSVAVGLLAFSSRQFALTYNRSWTLVRITLFFLPEQA